MIWFIYMIIGAAFGVITFMLSKSTGSKIWPRIMAAVLMAVLWPLISVMMVISIIVESVQNKFFNR